MKEEQAWQIACDSCQEWYDTKTRKQALNEVKLKGCDQDLAQNGGKTKQNTKLKE